MLPPRHFERCRTPIQPDGEHLSAEGGNLGAARDPRDRLGGEENSAMIVAWGFSIVCGTSKLLDQFAIRLENGAIGTGKLYAAGMISQYLVTHPARDRATVLIQPSRTERRPVLGSRP